MSLVALKRCACECILQPQKIPSNDSSQERFYVDSAERRKAKRDSAL